LVTLEDQAFWLSVSRLRIRARSSGCARPATGQVVFAPGSVMNSRRLIILATYVGRNRTGTNTESGRASDVRFGSKADSSSAATNVR